MRPVTSTGHPAAGYTVKPDTKQAMCGDASFAAVDAGIAVCGPSAAYLPACWKSTNHTALCLRHATDKVLARITYTGSWDVPTKAAVTTPLNMRLEDGNHCQIRVGGAWGTVPKHSDWLGYASCDKDVNVYGASSNHGIDRTTTPWSVSLYNETSRQLSTGHVAVAYFVGTAAG